MTNEKELLEAKRKLYSLLLGLGTNLSDTEVDIMFALSNDKQIVKLFQDSTN